MRASALIADESYGRIEARGRVESALELERATMTGAPTSGGMELAVWIEKGVRRMLRDAALGELGTDLGTAADESLIASGLAEGDAEISVSAITAEPPEDRPDEPDEAGDHLPRPRVQPGRPQGLTRHPRTRSGGDAGYELAQPTDRNLTFEAGADD